MNGEHLHLETDRQPKLMAYAAAAAVAALFGVADDAVDACLQTSKTSSL